MAAIALAVVADDDDSLTAQCRLTHVGGCRHAATSLLQSVIGACRREGVLKLIVDDDQTKALLCELLTECGLHPPHSKTRGGRRVHQFYIDLYARVTMTSGMSGVVGSCKHSAHQISFQETEDPSGSVPNVESTPFAVFSQ